MPDYKKLPRWMQAVSPLSIGTIKNAPDDFVVREVLGFKPSGQGEHLLFQIEKTGLNTQEAVTILSKHFSVQSSDIAYSGLKDKHAVTSQWFSARTTKQVDAEPLRAEGLNLLQSARHHRKLKRGAHQANDFEIILRDIDQTVAVNKALERIEKQGVPNYFGEQRFGRGGKNIEKALMMFEGKNKAPRHLKSILLSAARSFLFNEVLSKRVRLGHWQTGIKGEVYMLSGSNSHFKSGADFGQDEAEREHLTARLDAFDIHPSAPLWGKGMLATEAEALVLEQAVIKPHTQICDGLVAFGLRQQRRATRLEVQNLRAEWLAKDVLKLCFRLTKGSYATAVIRELVTIDAP